MAFEHFSTEIFYLSNFNPLLRLWDLVLVRSPFLFLALAGNEIGIICPKSMNSSAMQAEILLISAPGWDFYGKQQADGNNKVGAAIL